MGCPSLICLGGQALSLVVATTAGPVNTGLFLTLHRRAGKINPQAISFQNFFIIKTNFLYGFLYPHFLIPPPNGDLWGFDQPCPAGQPTPGNLLCRASYRA
jgi:hypothetical protein